MLDRARRIVAVINRYTTPPLAKTSMIRQWFSWGVSIPFLGLIGWLLEFELPKSAAHLKYIALYVVWGMTALWLLGIWLTSKFLESKNPEGWRRAQLRRFKFNPWHAFNVWKWTGVVLVLGLAGAGFWTIRWLQEEHALQRQEEERARLAEELRQMEGRLYPANEAIPQTTCGGIIKDDSLMVFLGSIVAVPQTLPATVLLVNDRKLLALDRDEDGALAISLEIRSADGKIITQIQRGRFTVNPNNILRMERKDRSS